MAKKAYKLKNKKTKRFWNERLYNRRPSLKWPGGNPNDWEVVSYELGEEKLDPKPESKTMPDKFFKIRHKPTGEYWKPGGGYGTSKKGKVYHQKPSLKFIQYARDDNPKNWEIVIFKIEEEGVING